MKTTINHRFEQMISALGLTRNAFAVQIVVASTVIYNIIGGRNAPSFNLLSKIALTFPTVNIKWLLTGEGNVLTMEGQGDGLDMLGKIKILEDRISEIEGSRTKDKIPVKKKLRKVRA